MNPGRLTPERVTLCQHSLGRAWVTSRLLKSHRDTPWVAPTWAVRCGRPCFHFLPLEAGLGEGRFGWGAQEGLPLLTLTARQPQATSQQAWPWQQSPVLSQVPVSPRLLQGSCLGGDTREGCACAHACDLEASPGRRNIPQASPHPSTKRVLREGASRTLGPASGPHLTPGSSSAGSSRFHTTPATCWEPEAGGRVWQYVLCLQAS